MKLRWPMLLSSVPGFPAILIPPFHAHGIKTVGDLVARVKQSNPSLLPPLTAFALHCWQSSYPITNREPAWDAARALVAYLGYGEHERPADWTDPPTPQSPQVVPMAAQRRLPTASLNLHPQAKLVPEMPPDQYKRFLEDVKVRGVLDPLELIHGTKMVIEGRTRLRAAIEAKLDSVPVVDADLRGDSPVVYMLRSALLRRQLTKSQSAALAVEVESQLKKEAKERQRQGGSRGGQSGRPKVPERIPEPSPAKKLRGGEAREQAAAAAGVNPRYVSDAKKVKAKDPELFEQVKSGKVTLPEATRTVKGAEKPRPKIVVRPSKQLLHAQTTKAETNTLPEPSPEPFHKATKERGGDVALQPCPFCGSSDLATVMMMPGICPRQVAQHVRCEQCGATGPSPRNADKAIIQAAWNRRNSK